MERFNCDDISAVLSGLLDGELDREARHLAEVHLAHCEKCRALVNEAEELDAQVRSAVGVGESGWSDEAMRRVLFAIDEPGRELKVVRRLRLSAWVGWGTAIAALLMLAFVVTFENNGFTGGDGSAKLAAGENGVAGNGVINNNDEDGAGSGGDHVALNDGIEKTVVKKGSSDKSDKVNESAGIDGGVGDVSNEKDISTKTAMNDGGESDEEGNIGDGVDKGKSGAVIDLSSDIAGVSSRLASFVASDVPAEAALADNVEAGMVEGGAVEGGAVEGGAVEGGAVDAGDRVAMGGGDGITNDNGGSIVMSRDVKPMDTGVKDDGEVADVDPGNGTDDILYSAAVLLRALQGADDDSFDDVREINQAIEFDDLLDRLAASRKDVWSDDAAVVDKAWAALEWVSGPVDQGQLRQVQTMIANEDLAGRLERMSGEYGTY